MAPINRLKLPKETMMPSQGILNSQRKWTVLAAAVLMLACGGTTFADDGPFGWMCPSNWGSSGGSVSQQTTYAAPYMPTNVQVAPVVQPNYTVPTLPTAAPTYAAAAYTPSTTNGSYCVNQTVCYTPEVKYRWRYAQIQRTNLLPVQQADPCTGCVQTTYKPVTSYSMLPWLHREPYIDYKPTTRPATSGCATCPTPCDPCSTGACATGTCGSGACGPSTFATNMAPTASGCSSCAPDPGYSTNYTPGYGYTTNYGNATTRVISDKPVMSQPHAARKPTEAAPVESTPVEQPSNESTTTPTDARNSHGPSIQPASTTTARPRPMIEPRPIPDAERRAPRLTSPEGLTAQRDVVVQAVAVQEVSYQKKVKHTTGDVDRTKLFWD